MTETYTTTTGQFTLNLKDLGELISPYIVNTEQILGVNEIEGMIDNMISDHDFSSTIRDVIDYDYDFVTECDVADIVRDYCDGEGFITADQVADVTELAEGMEHLRNVVIRDMQMRMLSMQAELDFLHEKHVENVERRLGYRISNFVSNVRSLPARLWSRVPKFTITRKDNNG